MGLSSFYNSPKPRQFSYKPRFYDPATEKFKEVKERIDREMAEENNNHSGRERPKMKPGFLHSSVHRTSYKPKKGTSSIRLYLLIVFLGLLAYLLLKM